jgi:imidazolonepropionase-like amidohydrolase
VAAGLEPPASFVAGVRAALQAALQESARTTLPQGIDSGTTRATRSTVRGVLKRFEDAFGLGTNTARIRRER